MATTDASYGTKKRNDINYDTIIVGKGIKHCTALLMRMFDLLSDLNRNIRMILVISIIDSLILRFIQQQKIHSSELNLNK